MGKIMIKQVPIYRHHGDRRGVRKRNGGAERALLAWNSTLRNRQETCFMDIVRIIIAILLPPLGVFMQVGLGKHFWINIVLTIFGYIPGIIHAIWVIAKY